MANASRKFQTFAQFTSTAFVRGFQDRREARDFPSIYEISPRRWQVEYEGGRQFAAWCQRAGLDLDRVKFRPLTDCVIRLMVRAFGTDGFWITGRQEGR